MTKALKLVPKKKCQGRCDWKEKISMKKSVDKARQITSTASTRQNKTVKKWLDPSKEEAC